MERTKVTRASSTVWDAIRAFVANFLQRSNVYERGDTTEGTVCECRLQEFKKAACCWMRRGATLFTTSFLFLRFSPCYFFFLLLSFFFPFFFFFFLRLLPEGPETTDQRTEKELGQGQNERKRPKEKRNMLEWRETRIVSFFAALPPSS